MNSPTAIPLPTPLARLTRLTPARVTAIDWALLSAAEGQRLRELGLDEGVEVELLHRAAFGRGPLACRFGRMTLALRSHVAQAIHVTPVS